MRRIAGNLFCMNGHRESSINLTETFDYSVNDVVWSPDSKSLFFNADDKGNVSIFKVAVSDKKITKILDNGFNTSLCDNT